MHVCACIWGREIYDSGNKKGMVGCNYGGRYATGEGGGGAGDRGRCDLRLYKRLVSTQQHVCGPKEIIKNNITIFL